MEFEDYLSELLNEYNKVLISKLIKKNYSCEKLRELAKIVSEKTDLLVYNENETDGQVMSSVKEIIRQYSMNKYFPFN